MANSGGNDPLPWIFFLAGLATRIPFTSRFLFNMDSGQFVLALDHFDVTVHQPHPPGYFLYVMLGRLIHFVVNDGNAVFVSVSVLFSGLAVGAVYLLGKDMFDRKTGAIAALLALTSPNVWFHGEVALTYIAEGFFSAAIALCCWKVNEGEEGFVWISAFAMGIAGGVRQNTVVFLFPLWIYSIRNLPTRTILGSCTLLGGTLVSWFVPMVWMNGGWGAYWSALHELWVFHTGGHSVYDNGGVYLKLFSGTFFVYLFFVYLVYGLVYGLGVGVLPLGLGCYSLIRRRKVRSLSRKRIVFLSFWILPGTCFYLFVFISLQNPGYMLILLPAIFLMTSHSIVYLGNEFIDRYRIHTILWTVVAVALLNTVLFFSWKIPVSYPWIRRHDRDLSLLLEDIKKFDAADTVIFVNNYIYYSYRHIMVYLPQYRVYNVDVRKSSSGKRRKTFWGIHGETHLADRIILPPEVRQFVSPLDIGDRKFRKVNVYEKAGIDVTSVSPGLRLANARIDLLHKLYPDLEVRVPTSPRKPS